MESKLSTNNPTGAQRIGPHTYHISGENSTVVTFTALPDTATIDTGRINSFPVPNESRSIKIMYWGESNNLPQYREECITGNNIVPALIERKRNIICGQGWYAYQEKFIDDGSGQMVADRDEVPMPPFHPKATVPAPAPTAPSSTAPAAAASSAADPDDATICTAASRPSLPTIRRSLTVPAAPSPSRG